MEDIRASGYLFEVATMGRTAAIRWAKNKGEECNTRKCAECGRPVGGSHVENDDDGEVISIRVMRDHREGVKTHRKMASPCVCDRPTWNSRDDSVPLLDYINGQ